MGNIKPFVDCSSVVKAMNKIKNAYETSPVVFERTLKDMRSRAPGKVASAVTSVYGIKKSEIKCKSNSFKRGAGKIYARGNDLASFELLYYGRSLTPLHFGMTPSVRPNKKQYKVKAKIKKNKATVLKAEKNKQEIKGGAIFLASNPKKPSQILPWERLSPYNKNSSKSEKNAAKYDIRGKRTMSLPQMVDNWQVRKIINKNLGELCKKRFDNALKQHLNRKLK